MSYELKPDKTHYGLFDHTGLMIDWNDEEHTVKDMIFIKNEGERDESKVVITGGNDTLQYLLIMLLAIAKDSGKNVNFQDDKIVYRPDGWSVEG